MSGHHFSASAFTSASSASGVCRSCGKISTPRSARRDRAVGSANAWTAAPLSRSTISFGVPFGAKSAYQPDKETIGSPISPKVGMSGASAKRVYRAAHKAIWLAAVEAADEHDAIERVAKERNLPAAKLIAVRHRRVRP